jgi:hypothetical protein
MPSTAIGFSTLAKGLEQKYARTKECMEAMPANVDMPDEYAELTPEQLAGIFTRNVDSLLGNYQVHEILDFIKRDPSLFLSESGELQQALLD